MGQKHAANAIAALAALTCAATAHADVESSPVFSGDMTDTFDQYSNVIATQSLDCFGGFGALQNLSEGGAIKVEFASQFLGDLVVPISGMMAGQLGIGQWVFDEPITAFGAWWENNSGQDDATVVFYDELDAPIGTVIADVPVSAQAWTWNGWTSDVPIARIEVTGNGVLNGFLWYENVQIVLAPEPCATDVDGDGTTGVADLVAVITAWGTDDAAADVDGSGLVDVSDLVEVIQGWGDCG